MKKIALMMLVASALTAAPVKWEHDLEAAKVRAKAEHKLIFCDLWTGWCGWCLKLQKDTFPSPEAEEALAKFVPVSIMTQDKKGEPTAHKHLEAEYKVEGFPTLLILDAQGKTVSVQPGYLQPKPFQAWLNGVAAEHKKK